MKRKGEKSIISGSRTTLCAQKNKFCIKIFFFEKCLFEYKIWLFFFFPPTSHERQFYGLTSGFTRLIMKTKYVFHSLIYLHVNFHDNWTMQTVILIIKNCRWGEKVKEPKIRIAFERKTIKVFGAISKLIGKFFCCRHQKNVSDTIPYMETAWLAFFFTKIFFFSLVRYTAFYAKPRKKVLRKFDDALSASWWFFRD